MHAFLYAPTVGIKGREISPNLEILCLSIKSKNGRRRTMRCDLGIFYVATEDFGAHWLSQYQILLSSVGFVSDSISIYADSH